MQKNNSKHPAARTKAKRTTLKDYLAALSNPNQSLSDVVDQFGYPKIIRMIDRGLNDYNFATPNCCLSLIMAARYMGIVSALETMQDPYFHPAPRLLKKYRAIHKNLKKDLNTVLRIYKKLKATSKGLNWPILNAYEESNPSAKLTEQFKMMDNHLIHRPNFSSPALAPTPRGRNA